MAQSDLDVRFTRYTDHLLSLEQQLEQLRRYNSQYWEKRLDEEELAAVVVDSEHQQSVSDLQVLHVEFGSPEETAEMWWRVYRGEQPAHWRNGQLRLDPNHFRLLNSNVQTYDPGAHRIRINLVAHWQPEIGRMLIEVRKSAAASGQILAHTEVLSAYGLHSELFREQNGTDLPYTDLAGTDVTFPGSSRPYALALYWGPSAGGCTSTRAWSAIATTGGRRRCFSGSRSHKRPWRVVGISAYGSPASFTSHAIIYICDGSFTASMTR